MGTSRCERLNPLSNDDFLSSEQTSLYTKRGSLSSLRVSSLATKDGSQQLFKRNDSADSIVQEPVALIKIR